VKLVSLWGNDMNAIPHIIILSKNEILREGLRRILADQGFVVDQTAVRLTELGAETPLGSVLLVDGIIFEEGLQTCQALREKFPDQKIVLMTDDYSVENVTRAFSTGAIDGYIVKAMSCEPLAGALRLISLGEKVIPSQVVDSLSGAFSRAATPNWQARCAGANLSSREVEILRCLVDGDPNKVISRRLSITDATVKVHIKAILRKLRVKNRTQAAIWAVERGLNLDVSGIGSLPQAAVA
jgi:two-component system nitrate/nitrite response regulator NarL